MNAIVLFAVFRISFTRHGESDSGKGHQIAFVSRIDKHFRVDDSSVFRCDFYDTSIVLADGFQSSIAQYHDSCFACHGIEKLFGNMRFNRIGSAGCRTAFSLKCFSPMKLFSIVGNQSGEVLASDSADTTWVADINRA